MKNIIFRIALLFMTTIPVTGFCDAVSLHNDIKSNLTQIAYLHTILKKDFEGLPQLFLADRASIATGSYLKGRISKTRPNGACCSSFPSGHTYAAFAPAWYIHQRYGIKESWPYLAAASFVGYQRIRLDHHYTEDVLASVLLTYASSRLFVGEGKGAPVFGIGWNEGLQLHYKKAW